MCGAPALCRKPLSARGAGAGSCGGLPPGPWLWYNAPMSIVFRLLRYLVGIAVTLCVLGAGVLIYALTDLNRPAGSAEAPQQLFTIGPGEGAASIATRLEQEHLIGSATLFRLDLRLRGVEEQIQAGDFQLSAGMTPQQIIDSIT